MHGFLRTLNALYPISKREFISITKEVDVNSYVSVDDPDGTIQGVHQEGEEWQALNGDELAEDD